MNFKRKNSKRKIRCSLCTQHRWLGNSQQRHNHQTLRQLQQAKEFAKIGL